MENYVQIINKMLGLGTIFLQLVIMLLAVNFIFFKNGKNKILLFFKKYTFHLGFLLAFGAVSMSLFYSEIIGYPPCELCWMQRVFLYPQLVLFGVKLFKKENIITDSSMIFAIIGAFTSVYHIYVENGGTIGATCADPSTGGVSCAVRYVYEFGYVGIPMMALTMSVFIILILLNYKYMSKI